MSGPDALLGRSEALMFLGKTERFSSQEFFAMLRFPRLVLCDGSVALAAVDCLDQSAKLSGCELTEHAMFHGIHVDLGVAGQLNR